MNQREMNRLHAFDGMVPIDLRLARMLSRGTTVYERGAHNADGTARRWRVTSVKTWKKAPERIEIRLQHGLRDYATIDQHGLDTIVVDVDTRDRLTRLAHGLIPYDIRQVRADGSYSWISAWINPATREISHNGVVIGYAAIACDACGQLRADHVASMERDMARLNPYPKLCSCSTKEVWNWYADPTISG